MEGGDPAGFCAILAAGFVAVGAVFVGLATGAAGLVPGAAGFVVGDAGFGVDVPVEGAAGLAAGAGVGRC